LNHLTVPVVVDIIFPINFKSNFASIEAVLC
jgi:hypothetical protein